MKTRTIHENLDTSFVNVPALLDYLRKRQLTGCIRIVSGGYEGEIFLLKENRVTAREHDRITGKIFEGEEAVNRILKRTREPGGIIHVFQNLETVKEFPQPKKPEILLQNKSPLDLPEADIFPQKEQNGASPKKISVTNGLPNPTPKAKVSLPDFPFDLSNCVEDKVRHTNLSNEDWKKLMQLTAEILFEIDRILWDARINFSVLMKKICAEIASDYPFLNPSAEIFEYEDGKLIMRERINARLFTAGINEILRGLLQKLSANPKFAEIHRRVSQKLLALIHSRKSFYDRFHYTPQLEKILGV